jgi:ABC-type sugar transport system ATPase subunit
MVGENGAGKSTLMKILSGAYKMDSGTIKLNGKNIHVANPRHAQDLGISIIYQELTLTPNQTVATNIFLAREKGMPGPLGQLGFTSYRAMRRATEILLKRVGANFSANILVRNLSVAQQQLVEIAKALAGDAKVIIMDEPTSSLGESEVRSLMGIIRQLREQGLGIIFISHHLDEVFEIADRLVVLRDGQCVAEKPIQDASINETVSLMVGRPIEETFIRTPSPIGQTVLEVKGLTRKGILEDINFDLKRGEILGIAGLVGSGRTELVRALFGADPITRGQILIDGKPVHLTSPAKALRVGIGFVPEDRKQHGLILPQTVQRNIMLPNLDSLSIASIVRRGQAQKQSKDFVERLNIRTPSLSQLVGHLSGGNQQKVVLAKWLASNPKILILDEPTRGIDVGAKAEVYAIMDKLASMGIGIIMVSSELLEVLQMSDRILVMREGRATAMISRQEASQELIMSYASGSQKPS